MATDVRQWQYWDSVVFISLLLLNLRFQEAILSV
jgi:hypothetical protein